MNNFNKITHGNIDFKSKSAEMTSYMMDKVMSPYEGEVVKTNNSNCPDGYLVIRHYIDGIVYYSQFCGVSNSIVSLGDKVRGGSTLGFFSDKPITYSVLSSNLQYLNPEKFLNGSSTNTVEPDKEKKKDKPKEEKPKEREEPKDKDEYEINAVAPIALPIEFAFRNLVKGGKALKKMGKGMFQLHNKEKDEKLKKEKEESEGNLNEEISRIKKLLK